MRIALAIPTLNGGGAEHVMSTMASYWAQHGHDIHLITHDRPENDFYPMDGRVVRHGFDISKPPRHVLDTVRHNIQRVTLPRACMKDIRPDAVISFTVRMNTQNLIALLGTKIPVIVSERNNPLAQRQPLPFDLLRRHLYPRASALVVQTEAARAWALGFMPHGKVHVIPNPVFVRQGSMNTDMPEQRGGLVACSAGRLIQGKGFDLLIRAFHGAARDRPEWSLLILGEGEDRTRLEGIIRELGIQDRVHMPGRVKNPSDYMASSKLFVLSSLHEGFPNALIEAMAVGLPVISTNCPFGPSEIVNDGVDGILVPSGDVQALSCAMEYLMVHEDVRNRLGERARVSSEKFSLETVMHRWESLLETITPHAQRAAGR
jgi:glycosyltransferase involved in cell wall biosynthesis